MQLQSDRSHRLDEIKTQFRAREGYYRLMNSPDYSQRSQRAMGFSTGTANSSSSTASHEKTCIKISLVTISDSEQNDGNVRQQNRHVNSGSTIAKSNCKSRGTRDMKICFNVGRELFVYNYDGVRTGPDASNAIYKRSYKGSSPTCHDFNQATATPESISLLVGFSHGQVQLIDLNGCEDQESCKEFNVDRSIDKTRVTCIRWLPNSPGLFLVAHASGQLYLYKDDLPCGPAAPTYQLYKQSEGVVVYTCKTKTTRNPIYKWTIGVQHNDNHASNSMGSSSSLHKSENESCSLNEFAFSPCAKYLACVSQDGFLRVYCYDTMELVGRARSYYGGLSCVCWSPDGKYVVTGGEDDLVSVWSFVERRVVARGMGHKSWVSVVAFDNFYTGYDLKDSDVDNFDDDDEEYKEINDCDLEGETEDDIVVKIYRSMKNNGKARNIDDNEDKTKTSKNRKQQNYIGSNVSSPSHGRSINSSAITSYRLGSVGQDTQLCLWDLSDDLLQQPIGKSRISSVGGANSIVNLQSLNSNPNLEQASCSLSNLLPQKPQPPLVDTKTESSEGNSAQDVKNSKLTTSSTGGFLSSKGSGFTKTFSLVGKRDKRYFSQKNSDRNANFKNNATGYNGDSSSLIDDPTKLLGSSICPKMNEVPLIEPSVCKKISFERLTSLIFCQGGFITSCQDGYVFSWARPSRVGSNFLDRSYRPPLILQ